MKILLTGATGYLGSRLAHALVEEGHLVVALKRRSSSLHRLRGASKNLIVYDIDVSNLQAPFIDHGPFDVVVHTATCYGRSHECLSDIFAANVMFPLKLAEIASSKKTKYFINTDTYFNKKGHCLDYLGGYILSKRHFEDLGKMISSSSEMGFINIRLEHVYGPSDDPLKFVPWIFDQCFNDVHEIRLTSGAQERDFIYIDDVVRAFQILLGSITKFSLEHHEIELGSGTKVKLRSFVELVHNVTESSSKLIFGAIPDRKNEIMQSSADVSTLKEIGWNPIITLEQGVKNILSEIKLIKDKR